MKLLPKEFTTGLKKVTGEFLRGIWDGMGPSPKLASKKPRRVRRVVREHPPRRTE